MSTTDTRSPALLSEAYMEAVVRSLVLFACAAAGILGGGALISLAALGGCLIFVSLAAGTWGLLTVDLPERQARPDVRPSGPVFLDEYLRRKAAENW